MRDANDKPYQRLGRQLKQLREGMKLTLAEAAGAVEIDPEQLAQIEQGESQPAEDVLSLLLNHFDLSDKEYDRVWDLADYNKSQASRMLDESIKPVVMLVQPDNRVIYSDQFSVSTNKNGLVMNFLQDSPNGGQLQTVSRVGMSHQQAVQVLHQLQQSLTDMQQPPRALPAPSKTKSKGKTWPKNQPKNNPSH